MKRHTFPMMIRVTDEMCKNIKLLAEKEERTVSNMVRVLVKESLAKRGLVCR